MNYCPTYGKKVIWIEREFDTKGSSLYKYERYACPECDVKYQITECYKLVSTVWEKEED